MSPTSGQGGVETVPTGRAVGSAQAQTGRKHPGHVCGPGIYAMGKLSASGSPVGVSELCPGVLEHSVRGTT